MDEFKKIKIENKAKSTVEMSAFWHLFWVGWKDEHFYDFLGRMSRVRLDDLQKNYLESKSLVDEGWENLEYAHL